MSTFTRTTTPPFSANPLQTFVTFKQARRAAKGASPVAWLFAGLSVLALGQLLLAGTVRITIIMIVSAAVLCAIMALLGWRIWARPGPWKIFAVLAFVALDLVAILVQFSVLNLVIVGVTLNFSVIAFRGALAMKRLQPQAQMQADLDVF